MDEQPILPLTATRRPAPSRWNNSFALRADVALDNALGLLGKAGDLFAPGRTQLQLYFV